MSNSRMAHTDTDTLDPRDIDKRLTDLEIKASFAEDMVDELNQTIVRQQLQIDLLIRELMQLRQQGNEAQTEGVRSLRDELPPHY
jgi:SlyX protein